MRAADLRYSWPGLYSDNFRAVKFPVSPVVPGPGLSLGLAARRQAARRQALKTAAVLTAVPRCFPCCGLDCTEQPYIF